MRRAVIGILFLAVVGSIVWWSVAVYKTTRAKVAAQAEVAPDTTSVPDSAETFMPPAVPDSVTDTSGEPGQP